MKRRQRPLKKTNVQQPVMASPYEHQFRPVNRVALPYYSPRTYSAPVPVMVCPYFNNYPEGAASNDGITFTQGTFPYQACPVVNAPAMPPAPANLGYLEYKVIQPRPVLAYVLDNGPNISPSFAPVLPCAPQCQGMNTYGFQQTYVKHDTNVMPPLSYPQQQQQLYYQPMAGQYFVLNGQQAVNPSYTDFGNGGLPEYYYDPQEYVGNQSQPDEEKADDLANVEGTFTSMNLLGP